MSICLIERLFYPFLLTVVMVLITIYRYICLGENVIFYTTLLQETYHIEFPWQKLYLWIRCKYVKQVLPLIKVWQYHADDVCCPQNCQWGSEPKMFLALCPASSAGHEKDAAKQRNYTVTPFFSRIFLVLNLWFLSTSSIPCDYEFHVVIMFCVEKVIFYLSQICLLKNCYCIWTRY